MRVRYQTSAGWSPWLDCKDAWTEGQVLRIRVSYTRQQIIPLHMVRGAIEIEES